jgi:hypothetical protein
MSEAPKKEQIIDIKASVKAIIESIDQEREREIIKRRFGLYERKETLEQIGELLGITRERVRQLEKAILIRIKMVAERGELPDVTSCEKVIIRTLSDMGRVAKLHELTDKLLGKKSNSRERAHIAFIAELSPNLTVINETDNYENGVAIAEYGDEKKIKETTILLNLQSKPQFKRVAKATYALVDDFFNLFFNFLFVAVFSNCYAIFVVISFINNS